MLDHLFGVVLLVVEAAVCLLFARMALDGIVIDWCYLGRGNLQCPFHPHFMISK